MVEEEIKSQAIGALDGPYGLPLKSLWPEGTANRTDPMVLFDPTVKGGSVVTLYTPTQDEMHKQEEIQDDTRVNAIYVPLIKLNNRVLDIRNIEHMELYSKGMFPSLRLIINDINGMIQFTDVPGLDNVITLVLTPPNESGYKKISVDFYITECNFYGDLIEYNAVYKLLPLEDIQFKQVKFHHPSNGCINKHKYSGVDLCGLGPNAHPTTFEFLHVIAEETGLGFAATQHCKDVHDDRYRLISSEKYKDVIKNHIKFSGTNDTEMLDTWIDLNHYIVLANVYWIMHEDVKPNELTISALYGMDGTDSSTPKSEFKTVHRLITNSHENPVHNNMQFNNYVNITEPGRSFENGTNNSYNIFSNRGYAGGSDQMSSYDIKQIELSNPGVKYFDQYSFSRSKFLGFEMADMNPILKQTTIREKYFEKLRSKEIKVQLIKPNFGLQRGMLVTTVFVNYDVIQKHKLIGQSAAAYGATNEELTEEQKIENKNVLGNEDEGVINAGLTGIYYIDGLEFIYDSSDGFIKQYLYLIKQGMLSDLNQKGNVIPVTTPI